MSNFNTMQAHPLIPRKQTYVLDRKLISFRCNFIAKQSIYIQRRLSKYKNEF